jgi:hypothetical protein
VATTTAAEFKKISGYFAYGLAISKTPHPVTASSNRYAMAWAVYSLPTMASTLTKHGKTGLIALTNVVNRKGKQHLGF